jgi:hypothetical protein
MHLILTGATGLVGAAVLDSMLAQEAVSRISILSRRPVKMAEGHDKAKVVIHKDFQTYDRALLEELKDAQGCVWALGVSQNDVDKECAGSTVIFAMQVIDTATGNTSRSRMTTHSPPHKPSTLCTLTHPSPSSTCPARARHSRLACSHPSSGVSKARSRLHF